MDDKLNAIVQRMIDAGESEDNIGAVIKAYKPAQSNTPDFPTSISIPGGAKVMPIMGEKGSEPNVISKMTALSQGAASPGMQIASDALQLLPFGVAKIARGASQAVEKAVTAAQGIPKPGGMFPNLNRAVQGAYYEAKRTPFIEPRYNLNPAETGPRMPKPLGPLFPIATSMGQSEFNDIPLSRQMESLPATGPNPERRVGTTPYQPQTPFHERPLAEQMSRLPTGGPNPEGRPSIPVQPERVTTPDSRISTADLPTYLQQELLERSPGQGLAPSARFGSPPIPDTGGRTLEDVLKALAEKQPTEMPTKATVSSTWPPKNETPESTGPTNVDITPEKVAEMRRLYGSRDAAARLGMTEEQVLKMAPGPSRIPYSVEEKLMDRPSGLFHWLPR